MSRSLAAALFVTCLTASTSVAAAELCKYANSAFDKIAAGAAAVGSGTVAGAGLSAAGVTAVAHSSGAAILHAGGGYVAGTLGPVAAAAGIVTAPAAVTAGTLTVLGAGGVLAYCHYNQDQPPAGAASRRSVKKSSR